MNQSAVIAVFSFVILLVIAVLFLYLYFKAVHDEIVAYWNTILDKMRLRDDMVPNLVETLRKHVKGEDDLIEDLIALRSKSWPMNNANGPKVDIELNLTKDLHGAWVFSQKFPSLNLDTNFLSLKKDFHDLGKEIDEMVDVYNKKVRSFNGHAGFMVMKPVLSLMKLKKLQIFEFEP